MGCLKSKVSSSAQLGEVQPNYGLSGPIMPNLSEKIANVGRVESAKGGQPSKPVSRTSEVKLVKTELKGSEGEALVANSASKSHTDNHHEDKPSVDYFSSAHAPYTALSESPQKNHPSPSNSNSVNIGLKSDAKPSVDYFSSGHVPYTAQSKTPQKNQPSSSNDDFINIELKSDEAVNEEPKEARISSEFATSGAENEVSASPMKLKPGHSSGSIKVSMKTEEAEEVGTINLIEMGKLACNELKEDEEL